MIIKMIFLCKVNTRREYDRQITGNKREISLSIRKVV